MRASLPIALSLLLAPLALAVACGPQMTGQPAAGPETASSPPAASAAEPAPSEPTTTSAPATPAPAEPAPTAVECTKDEACSGADAGPLPLRAGKGTDPFAHKSDAAAKSAPPCTKDTLKKQLQSIVDACRKSSRSICGDLVLHTAAGKDAGSDNVSVDFNLGTSGDTLGFSKCVVGRINSVKWECAERGDDIHLDLGCRL